jgi:hypothetical protein
MRAMTRENAGPESGSRFTRFFERVDEVISPAFVAKHVNDEGPDDRSDLTERSCPICGHPMFEHRIDESTSNVLVECPTEERLPERAASGPLNEYGMPATGRRLEKYQRRAARAAQD